MNKIVTFGSPEYFELVKLGWYILQQVSASSVMMAHPGGTAFVDPRGKPQTNDDQQKWIPYWAGKGTPGEQPVLPHVWTEIIRATSALPETVILFADTGNPAPGVPGGYAFFRVSVEHGGVPFWSEDYHLRWDDANVDYNLRSITPAANTWFTVLTGTVPVTGEVVTLQWLVSNVAGSVQYRITYSAGPTHLFAQWSPAFAEYSATGAV